MRTLIYLILNGGKGDVKISSSILKVTDHTTETSYLPFLAKPKTKVDASSEKQENESKQLQSEFNFFTLNCSRLVVFNMYLKTNKHINL